MAGNSNGIGNVDLSTFLEGPWVTSYAGFTHDDPADTKNDRPPQLAAFRYFPPLILWGFYYLKPERWIQTNGFCPSAAMLLLKFNAATMSSTGNAYSGKLAGFIYVNRGGKRALPTAIVDGDYDLSKSSTYNVVEGGITFKLPPANIAINLRWYATSARELEFWNDGSVFEDKPYRNNISRGTLKYVEY